MKIQKANPDDAEKLTQIAMAAKRHWNYPERWMLLWKDALTITPEFIVENEVYALTEKGEIIGFYALAAHDDAAKLEHLWVNPQNIDSGIGRKLFAHALERASSLNVKMMTIDSDPNAEAFYKKMGAQRVGDIVTEIEGSERILPLMRIVF